MKKNSIILMALLPFAVLQAQQQHTFSVKQAVDYAMQNATQVKAALLDVKIQSETNRELEALAFYPQVNASLGVTHYFNIPVQSLPNFIAPSTYQVLVQEGVKDANGNPITFPAGGFGTIAAQFGVPWTANAGLEFSKILFDGQIFVGLQARSAVMDLARKNVEVTQEQIKANVYKVYYQLVVGKKQLGSIDANIERVEKLLNDVTQIYKNGFAERLDIDKVQVLLNNLKTEKQKIEYALQAGHAGLKFLMHVPQKDEVKLTDTISNEVLKEHVLADSIDYNSRKDLQYLSLAKKLNEYNVRRYKLSAVPTVVAFGTYQKNAQRDKFNFFNKGDWFTTSLIGFTVKAPIFDGFARKAKIQKAQLEVQKLETAIDLTKQSVDLEVANAQSKMTAALLTIDAQTKNITLAEKVYQTTKKKYEQGLGSNQEIYDAQAELKVAQTNYYSALYDALSAKIDYLKAIGKL